MCGKCRVRLTLNIEQLIRLNGEFAILWGRRPRCRVEGCEGRVAFQGRWVRGQTWRSMADPPPRHHLIELGARTLGAEVEL